MAQFENAASCWRAILSDVTKNRGLLPVIEKFARENIQPAKIVFGTSGWRGEIGTDFTFNAVRFVNLGNHRTVQKKRSRFHGGSWRS
jgi:phosphomannomutase